MQGVLDFPELKAPAKRPPRTYFALLPDAETTARITALAGRVLSGQPGRWRRSSAGWLHLSLHPVWQGMRLPSRIPFAAERAAARVAARPFRLCCGEVMSFRTMSRRPDPVALVLCGTCDALRDLHRSLGAAMAACGFRNSDRFAPHITLARGPQALPPLTIDPIRFAVRDFALVHSGETYRVIHRWPLCG